MKNLTLIFFCFISLLSFSQEKYHRAKLYYNSQESFNQLLNSGITIDHGIHIKNKFFESDFSEKDLQRLSQLGYNYKITIEDVQQFYIDQNNPESIHFVSKEDVYKKQKNTTTTYPTPSNFNLGSMGGYLTYEEALQEIDDMYQYCIDNGIDIISKRKNIDQSDNFKTKQGRYLQWVKISDNPNSNEITEPQTLYTAIHHAREPTSIHQLIFYMWYLIENYNTNDEVKAIVNNNELYFIPFVNPDGYILNQIQHPYGGGMHRKNTNGVDNNRNYSYKTATGKETWGTSTWGHGSNPEMYPGTEPFSEPENKAVRYFIENHNFRMALNAHSAGNMLLFPYGYANSAYTEDHIYYLNIGNIMTSKNSFNNTKFTGLYEAAGTSDDYMYGSLTKTDGSNRQKTFAFTPEIGHSFWLAKNEIESVCEQMVFTNLVSAKLSNNYAQLKDSSNNTTTELFFPITFSLQRYGLTKSGEYTVSITPVSSNILNVEDNKTFSNLELNETIDDEITITLDGSISYGDTFTFKLNLDYGDHIESQTITKTFEGTLSENQSRLTQSIFVYPNPVNNYLTIKTSLNNYKYSLSNCLGKTLISSYSKKGNITIDYSNYTTGIYILNIISNDGKQKSFKIIKH